MCLTSHKKSSKEKNPFMIAEQRKASVRQRIRPYMAPVLFFGADYAAILASGSLSNILYGLPVAKSCLYLWFPLILLISLIQSKAYANMQPIIYTVRSVFYAITFAVVASIAALYFFTGWQVPRSFFVVFWLLLLVMVCTERLILNLWLKHGRHLYEDAILIGAGRTAERVLHFFKDDLGYRYRIAGIIDDNPISDKIAGQYGLLGKVSESEQLVKDSHVQTVLITAPGMERGRLQALIAGIQPHVRRIAFVPDLIGMPMANVEAKSLFREEILMIHIKNNLALRRNRIYKRLFDLTLTVVGGIAILPVLLVLAICIKLDSKGSVFYNADRIGRNGRIFKCYKFRTMYENSEEILQEYLAKNPAAAAEWKEYAKLRGYDPRVTKAGIWMRKYSLDELPQILNVLLGDMSLVGPRPYLPREKADIGKNITTIAMSLPGITGYWQVSGRNDVSFQERVSMDIWYVQNWSVWLDILYLAKTFQVVCVGRGAY